MEYKRHFTQAPKVCGGETVSKGTCVTLRTLLVSLREGATVAEIVQHFPT